MHATKVLRITLSVLHLFLSRVKFWVSLVVITNKEVIFNQLSTQWFYIILKFLSTTKIISEWSTGNSKIKDVISYWLN